MKVSQILLTVAASVAGIASGSSIAQIASANQDLSTLVDLLTAAELVQTFSDPGTYTVFAPDNDAFGELPVAITSALKKTYNADLLTETLTHHAAGVERLAASFDGTPTQAMLNGEEVTVDLNAGPPATVTSSASVVAGITGTDIPATNGVVHTVNKVLLPTKLTPVKETVVDIAATLPTLSAAVTAAELVDALKAVTDDGYTVFAPTEEAFEKFLQDQGLTAEELLAKKDLLVTVLKYHVLPTYIKESDVTAAVGAGGAELETLDGEKLDLTAEGKLSGDTTIVSTDLRAYNGIVHTIDKVLVPPSLGENAASSVHMSVATVAVAAAVAVAQLA